MRRTVCFLLILAAAGCNEPMYQGRSLSSWMYDLDAEDDYKRRAAAEAMGGMGEKAQKAIPKLVDLLEDTNPGVQAFAEDSLVKIGPSSIPALEEQLARPEPAVRMHAAAALVRIDPKHQKGGQVLAQAATGVGNADLAKLAQDVVVKLGADGVPLLLPYLDDPYEPVRLTVIKTIGKMKEKGRSAFGPIKERLEKEKSTEHRLAAMQALAKIGDPKDVAPVLRSLLEDEDGDIADNAGALLRYIGARDSASGYEGGDQAAEGDAQAASNKEKKAAGKAGAKKKGK